MRRQFDLPFDDVEYLDASNFEWETVIVNEKERRLIVHKFPIPSGYNHTEVMINLRIDGYPESQLDMVYVYPHLYLTNGKTISKLEDNDFDGKTWQRWSRHNFPDDQYRQGVDDISAHLTRVQMWFEMAKT